VAPPLPLPSSSSRRCHHPPMRRGILWTPTWEARVPVVEGRRGGDWHRWWLGGEASWWLGGSRSRVCVLQGARSRSRACAPLPARRACLYSGGRAVYGAVAFISGVEIRGIGVGNGPASRYEPPVSGGERAAPTDASLCGGRR
jgi:hypothetical protein